MRQDNRYARAGRKTQKEPPRMRRCAETSSVLSALKARTQGIPAPEEPAGRERPQVPSTGRPPGGPAAFRLPLPPAMWLRRPYDRDEYNLLRSMLGEIEADPLTPRDYFW